MESTSAQRGHSGPAAALRGDTVVRARAHLLGSHGSTATPNALLGLVRAAESLGRRAKKPVDEGAEGGLWADVRACVHVCADLFRTVCAPVCSVSWVMPVALHLR
jgi:hypothetical protein